MIKRFAMFAAACYCLASAPLCPAESWPEFIYPAEATAQVVAQDMVFNGIPMRVLTFQSKLSSDQMVKFYQRRWKRHGAPEPALSKLGEWRIVGMMDGEYYKTAQVKAERDGSTGYLGISLGLKSIGKTKPVLGAGAPVPFGSVVRNDIYSVDLPKKARTVILTNRQSVDFNLNYYLRHYQGDGWGALMKKRVREPEHGAALVFRKGVEEASVAISEKNGQTVVFLNTVGPAQ